MFRAYYSITPANVRYDKDLIPHAKLLYGEITALCNEKGYCWASNNYFAELYGVSTKSISKWINQLVKKGYIYSQMIYKDNTKAIKERRLYIAPPPMEENFNTYGRKLPYPMEEKFQGGMEEKFQDNNTVFNNKKNIYSSSTDEQQTQDKKSSSKSTTKVKNLQFETLWRMYPNKKGRAIAEKKVPKLINQYGYEQIERCIKRYVKEIENMQIEKKYIVLGSTFFNSRFEDYLDENFEEVKEEKKKGKVLNIKI